MTENFFRKAIEGSRFSFTQRPEPVAGDLRMSWGIGVLLLSLFHANRNKASFQKLQFLAHAVRTAEGREEVRDLMAGNLRAGDVSVRVEPWLNRAVSYANGLGLVNVTKGKSVSLSDKGKDVAETINADKSVFVEERAFLERVAKGLTEVQVSKIWRMEDTL